MQVQPGNACTRAETICRGAGQRIVTACMTNLAQPALAARCGSRLQPCGACSLPAHSRPSLSWDLHASQWPNRWILAGEVLPYLACGEPARSLPLPFFLFPPILPFSLFSRDLRRDRTQSGEPGAHVGQASFCAALWVGLLILLIN